MTKFNDLDAFERDVIARASIWTTFVQISPHDRRRTEHASCDEAMANATTLAAELNRPIMMYAVTPEGRSTMFGSVRPNGEFHSALRNRPKGGATK